MDRKDAVYQEFKQVGTRIFKDSKGEWTAGYVRRVLCSYSKEFAFELFLSFKANPSKADAWIPTVPISMWGNEEAGALKRRIKTATGYTPERMTVENIYAHFEHLRDAYYEQDCYYAGQDKQLAEKQLDALVELAVQRAKSGESIEPLTPDKSFKKYLTREEIEQAAEAQKVVLGHSHVEPISSVEKTGHLAEFNQRIETRIRQWEKLQELERQRQLKENLLAKLDSDVTFRKLVANALEAQKEVRSNDPGVELAYRLFGYARNLDEYRDRVVGPFTELMNRYGLNFYDANKLISLGREYLQNGGMLPIPEAPYQREDGIFYYNDSVHNGYAFSTVTQVGKKYVYVSGAGGRWERKKTQHFIKAFMIQNPISPDDHLYNELASLHNTKNHPNAHLKDFEDVVRTMYRRKTYFHNPELVYKKMLEKDDLPPGRRVAIEKIHDGLVYHSLLERIDIFRSLKQQATLNEVERCIYDLKKKHGFQFDGEAASVDND